MIAAGIMAFAIGTFPASLKASCTDIKGEKPAVHRLKGRIIDQDGASVEYVAVGIPGSRTGTVSSADGKFELEIPADETDSLVFRHVSYMTERIPASECFHGRNAVAGAGGIFCEHSIRRMFGKRQERMGGAEDMDREKIRRSLCQQPADVPAVFQVQPCQKRSHGGNITMRTEHRYVGLWH